MFIPDLKFIFSRRCSVAGSEYGVCCLLNVVQRTGDNCSGLLCSVRLHQFQSGKEREWEYDTLYVISRRMHIVV